MKELEHIEVKALACCIEDVSFLTTFQHLMKPEYIVSRQIDKLLKIIFKYAENHGEAPKEHIQDLFIAWKKGCDNDSEIEMMYKVIQRADSTSIHNTDYVLGLVKDYFRKRSIEILKEELCEALEVGNNAQAIDAISNYGEVASDLPRFVSPFDDAELIERAFEKQPDPMIRFKGGFGKKFNRLFVPSSLIGFMAPEKRGKTWMLQEFVFAAKESGKNVVFASIGDMNEAEMTQRLHSRLAGRPIYDLPDGLTAPTLDCVHCQVGDCPHSRKKPFDLPTTMNKVMKEYTGEPQEVSNFIDRQLYNGYKPCPNAGSCSDWDKTFFYKRTTKPIKKLGKKLSLKKGVEWMSQNECEVRLVAVPNSSMTVTELTNLLTSWEKMSNYVTDVLIVDYADLFLSEGRDDYRHKQNEVWKQLKRLAQEKNILIITATQADASSYSKEKMSLDNFSEDKRKYAHVNAMLSLNQTATEKEFGILRVGTLLVRSGRFNSWDEVTCLQCLDIGRPIMASY